MLDIFIETNRLLIEPISANNYESVTKMYKDTNTNSYATGVFGEISLEEIESRTMFCGKHETGFSLLAKTKDKKEQIGYIKGIMIKESKGVFINTLIITPENHRKGYGREIVSEIAAFFANNFTISSLAVSVMDENTAAKMFWLAQGLILRKTLYKSGVCGEKLSKIHIYAKNI